MRLILHGQTGRTRCQCIDPSESSEITGAEHGHVHGRPHPIITSLEIYDIITV
jgi:hypothetical protein